MAGFNQEPNILDPNYLGYSRGTSGAHIASLPEPVGLHKGTEVQYQANRSGAVAIGSIAEGLGPLATGIKQAYLEGARKDVDATLDPVRDQFNRDLDTAISKGAAGADKVLGTSTQPQGLPTELSEADRTLGKYATAKAGKYMTEREYAIATEAKLQELRERYPGFTEDIDRMVKSKLGFDPANFRWQASLNALVSMQQAAQANANAAEKEMRFVMEHTSPAVHDAVRSGKLTLSQAKNIAYDNIGAKNEIELLRSQHAYNQELKKDDQETGLKSYAATVNYIVRDSYRDFAFNSDTAIAQLLRDVRSGKDVTADKNFPALVAALRGWQQRMQQDLGEVRKQPIGNPYGPTYTQVLNPTDMDQRDTEAMSFVNHVVESVTGKGDISVMGAWNEAAKANLSFAKWNQLQNPVAAGIAASNELYGPDITKALLSDPKYGGLPGLYGLGLLGGGVKGLGHADQTMQPDSTQRGAMVNALHTAIVNKTTQPAGVVDAVNKLTSADTWDYISRMQDKPLFSGGKSDKQMFFEQYVNPQVAESVYAAKNPETDVKYNRFSKELFILQAKQDISTIQQAYVNRDNIDIKFLPKQNKLVAIPVAPAQQSPILTAADAALALPVQSAIDRMNVRLKQIEPVLKNEGDVGEGATQLLGLTGLNLNVEREGDFITRIKRAVEGTPKSRAQGGGVTPAEKTKSNAVEGTPKSRAQGGGKHSFMKAPNGNVYYQSPDGQYYEVSVG